MAENRYTNKQGLQHAIDKIRAEIPYGVFALTADDDGNLYAETPDNGKTFSFELTDDGDINITF